MIQQGEEAVFEFIYYYYTEIKGPSKETDDPVIRTVVVTLISH